MVAESRHNLANWIMWLMIFVALPPSLLRLQQQLFSGRMILEGKGAEIVDTEKTVALTVTLQGPAFSDKDVVRLRNLPVDRLSLRESAITDKAISELARHSELEALDVSGTSITAAGIRQLAAFPNLRQLRLEDCTQLAVADLEPLANSRSLRILLLGAVNYSPAELKRLDAVFRIPVSVDPAAYLGTPSWLRPVWLRGKHDAVKITFFASPERPHQDEMLAMQLGALRHKDLVEQLHLYFLNGTETETLSRIEEVGSSFPNMKTVWIAGARNAELRSLRDCRALAELNAIDGNFDDDGIRIISEIAGLKRLRLHSPYVNGPGLAHLGRLVNLEFLEVVCTEAVPNENLAWASLDKLRSLRVDFRSAPGQRLSAIAELKSLEFLSFGKTDLSQSSLNWIQRLGNLKQGLPKVVVNAVRSEALE